MRELERRVVLSVLDRKWREHLYEMDYLREGIGLRAYSQRDPLVEYQREGFDLFNAMMEGIAEESVGFLFNLDVQVEQAAEAEPQLTAKGLAADKKPQALSYSSPSEAGEAEVRGETATEETPGVRGAPPGQRQEQGAPEGQAAAKVPQEQPLGRSRVRFAASPVTSAHGSSCPSTSAVAASVAGQAARRGLTLLSSAPSRSDLLGSRRGSSSGQAHVRAVHFQTWSPRWVVWSSRRTAMARDRPRCTMRPAISAAPSWTIATWTETMRAPWPERDRSGTRACAASRLVSWS